MATAEWSCHHHSHLRVSSSELVPRWLWGLRGCGDLVADANTRQFRKRNRRRLRQMQGARHVPWGVLSFKICKTGGLEENAGAFSIVTMMGGSHLLACIQTVVRDAVGTACT